MGILTGDYYLFLPQNIVVWMKSWWTIIWLAFRLVLGFIMAKFHPTSLDKTHYAELVWMYITCACMCVHLHIVMQSSIPTIDLDDIGWWSQWFIILPWGYKLHFLIWWILACAWIHLDIYNALTFSDGEFTCPWIDINIYINLCFDFPATTPVFDTYFVTCS